jgi:hypothetical protein
MQVFNACVPVIESGTSIDVDVSQALKQDDDGKLLTTTGPKSVKLVISGPQTKLEPSDILGVYPAPSSEESLDTCLPHIALARRTLPWERRGPGDGLPWLAVLLFNEQETSSGIELKSTTVGAIAATDSRSHNQLKEVLPETTSIFVAHIPNKLLHIPSKSPLPSKTEIGLLCHMKRTITTAGHEDVAMVIGNRLPHAGGEKIPRPHTALLVSLEHRDDLYENNRFADTSKKTVVIVLHHWTFTPSEHADFETVMKLIRVRPNGGVLRFGNLPQPHRVGGPPPLGGGFAVLLDKDGYFASPLPHEQPGNITFRGPLRPFPTGTRSRGFAVRAAPEEFENPTSETPLDYSYAAAFEIGRLLALADAGVLEDLRAIGIAVSFQPPDMVAINKLPPALQKPDWVQVEDHEWYRKPWSTREKDLVKDEARLLSAGEGNVTGLGTDKEIRTLKKNVFEGLKNIAAPGTIPGTQIDIGTVTGETLAKQFADVLNAAL